MWDIVVKRELVGNLDLGFILKMFSKVVFI